MSEDQEELNLNELVGNILSAHNEEELPSQLGDSQLRNLDEIPEFPDQNQNDDAELGDEDLAAVVAQAIGGMEDNSTEGETVGSTKNQYASAGSQALAENLDRPSSKEEEWAQILQQGLLQESQLNPHEQIDDSLIMGGVENLDHEDEALRRAILESLQNLNVGETQPLPTKKPSVPSKAHHKSKDRKNKDKKSKKKDAKKSDKSSSNKKKSSKKKKDSSKKTKDLPKPSTVANASEANNDADLLNFEDVIKGFMEQSSHDDRSPPRRTSGDQNGSNGNDANDAETQALVEATLRAFENELLSSSKAAPSTKHKSTHKSTSTRSKAAPTMAKPSENIIPISQSLPVAKTKKTKSSDHSKKKKSLKKSNRSKGDYNEDDFSKALAEMVNQVVNTSLSDLQPSVPAYPDLDSRIVPITQELTNAPASQLDSIPASASDVPIENIDTDRPITPSRLQKSTTFGSEAFDPSKELPSTKSTGSSQLPQELQSFQIPDFPRSAQTNEHYSDFQFPEKSTDPMPGAADVDPLLSFPDAKQSSSAEGVAETNDSFDLNQIMQNAMAMAFQGQIGHQISQSALDDFNQQLQGYNVSQLIEGTVGPTKAKKKSSKRKSTGEKKSKSSKAKALNGKTSLEKVPSAVPVIKYPKVKTVKSKETKTKSLKPKIIKTKAPETKAKSLKKTKSKKKKGISSQELSAALHASAGSIPELIEELPKVLDLHGLRKPGRPRKTPTPTPVSNKYWKKRYKLAAVAAAAKARRQRMDRNKAQRSKVKEERHARRQERHLKKEIGKLKEEEERKELEIIVAKGPPYPPDLRMTKKGTPKKPYRRYTADEMKRRELMPTGHTNSRIKEEVQEMPHKELTALSALKQIPLFNFARDEGSTKLRSRLNDIDGTIAQIPLTVIPKLKEEGVEYHHHHRRMIKSERTVEQIAADILSVKQKRRKHGKTDEFDPSQKTVVHREKTIFHPPWMIPDRPPIALPIARRRKRNRTRAERVKKPQLDRGNGLSSSAATFVSGNKIIPASLFPIINTLKAAARAKAAAGATPQEASKQLGVMLRNARQTIAQTLAKGRSQSGRNYGIIKTIDDIKRSQPSKVQQTMRRQPIFSLSTIKAIEDQEENSANLATNQRRDDEEQRKQGDKDKLTTSSSKVIASQDQEGPNMSRSLIALPKRLTSDDTHASDSPERERKEGISTKVAATTQVSTVDHFQRDKDIQTEDGKQSNRNDTQLNNSEGGDDQVDANITIKELPVEEISDQHAQPPLKKLKVATNIKLEEAIRIPPKEVSNSNLSKELHFATDELPPEVRAELTRAINDIMKPQENPRKKYTKRSTPVLNLEGLVPPRPVSKIEPLIPKSEAQAVKKEHRAGTNLTPKSSESPILSIGKTETRARTSGSKAGSAKPAPGFEAKFEFSIPTKNIKGESLPVIPILRRAKSYLNAEELTKLKKSMTNERKRKWREANASKNKDHDLRARLRKRANALFGDCESAAKSDWFTQEYAKRSVKIEAEPEKGSQEPIQELITSISDLEILNMIACLFDKENVSRAIEKEINDEANMLRPSKKPSKKKAGAPPQKPVKIDTTASAADDAQPSSALRSTGHDLMEASSELIDPIFAQIGKRTRDEKQDSEAKDSKRAKTHKVLKENLLKRPTYLNSENNEEP